jgi:carboxypeptidase PM20D1
LPTVSRGDGPGSDFEALVAFRRHLEACFPRVHAALAREIVNEHSLLFTWKGTDETAKPILLMAHMDVVPVEPGTDERIAVEGYKDCVRFYVQLLINEGAR